MRKSSIDHNIKETGPSETEWLRLEDMAKVEVTSEDRNFPIEFALASATGPGWRAAASGPQTIRIIFDRPRPQHRIRLEFSEMELERTQEFALHWSSGVGGPSREIVRQQWNFSPLGSAREVEDYRVELSRCRFWSCVSSPTSHRAAHAQLWTGGAWPKLNTARPCFGVNLFR